MTGFKDGRPGSLHFDSHDGFLHMAREAHSSKVYSSL
jgi:hypothetical protein